MYLFMAMPPLKIGFTGVNDTAEMVSAVSMTPLKSI
jgi:hypothetical protein